MEFITEIIPGACTNAVKKLWKWFTMVRSVEHELKSLRERTNMLSEREQDVMMELERKEVEQGMKRKREVDIWLQNVKRVKTEVDSVEEKVREEKGWIQRCRLGMHIADVVTEVVQLQERSGFSDGVAMEPLLGSGSPQPTATLLGDSANKTLRRIWNNLLDVEIRKVGVHGMAGVGKTTIMKQIHNQLLHSDAFVSIIWVTVSKELDLQRLQRDIADAIGLDLSNDCYDEEERISSKICAALSRREKCLLILDDVWEPFSLERVGIPQDIKLAITTRNLMVCRGMESDRIIKVEVLSDEEALTLFKEKVGGSVLDSSEIESIAKCIIKECGRLPLAIITVGRALRKVGDVSVWRNAVSELRCSYPEIHGMDEYVFPRLMFGYNRLRNDRIRDCFLYCALYPEDYSIDTETLIENWVGEGLIDEKGNIGKERDKGITILNELKDACMLEDSHLIEYPNIPTVKLHDLIRDLAIKITRERPRFMAKAREQLEESPRVEEWIEDTKRVSLMRNRIQLLSGQPKCPELTTLLLQNNVMLWEISNSFFENIQGLRVLDLSNSKIKFLPESFCKLENLHVLRLNDCKYLKKLPSLVRLRQLRILCLNWTSIKELPQEMEELVNLRKLHLEHTTRLQLIPTGVISKLSLLEDLRMRESGWRWPSTTSRETAVIEEIVNLTRITVLRLCFKDVQSFIKLVGSDMLRKVESFSLVIGDLILIQLPHPVDNVVLVGGGSDVGRNASSLILPFRTERLFIERCHDVTRLSQFSCLANATQLTSCHIEQCNGMESIIMAEEKTLIKLAYLHLYNLHNLRALSCGVPSIETFANLEMLNVEGCNKMKKLLSLELLQNLQSLGSIQIKNCCLMEDIVANDGNAVTTFSLPKLRYLRLEHLPELKSMFNTTVTCPSLESIGVGECPKLKKLPFTSKNLSPILKRLRGEKKWWDAMEWDDPNLKIQLQDCFIDRE